MAWKYQNSRYVYFEDGYYVQTAERGAAAIIVKSHNDEVATLRQRAEAAEARVRELEAEREKDIPVATLVAVMTYTDLCLNVDARAGKPVMTRECGTCGGDGYFFDAAADRRTCPFCHGTGRVPLPEAEGAWALLEWLDNRLVCFSAKLPNGYVFCYIHPRTDEQWKRIEGDGKNRRTALFDAAAKMLEQEATK